MAWDAKDPNEVLDYSIDWRPRLVTGDTIATVTWTIPAPLTQGGTSNTNGITSTFISGGVEAATYSILCRITTTGGRTMDQTVKLKIKSR